MVQNACRTRDQTSTLIGSINYRCGTACELHTIPRSGWVYLLIVLLLYLPPVERAMVENTLPVVYGHYR